MRKAAERVAKVTENKTALRDLKVWRGRGWKSSEISIWWWERARWLFFFNSNL